MKKKPEFPPNEYVPVAYDHYAQRGYHYEDYLKLSQLQRAKGFLRGIRNCRAAWINVVVFPFSMYTLGFDTAQEYLQLGLGPITLRIA